MGKPSAQRIILLMYDPPEKHLERLQAVAPNFNFRIATSGRDAAKLIEEAEIVFGNRYFIQSLPYAKRLRWMQSNSVGVDQILVQKDLLVKKKILLTCARGVYDAEMSLHTLGLILALFRSLHLLRDEQMRKSWQRHRLRALEGTRCLILGWGSLAQRIAGQLSALGCMVSGLRNKLQGSREGGFEIFGLDNWEDQLQFTDLLVLCLPATPNTTGFVGKLQLEKLPANSFVVNIGRGGTLDDSALVELVRNGAIAGAALDVFEKEPLPPDSPIWNVPQIIVSPHVGRSLEGPEYKWFSLFENNLERYVSGAPLLNVVDYDLGY